MIAWNSTDIAYTNTTGVYTAAAKWFILDFEAHDFYNTYLGGDNDDYVAHLTPEEQNMFVQFVRLSEGQVTK